MCRSPGPPLDASPWPRPMRSLATRWGLRSATPGAPSSRRLAPLGRATGNWIWASCRAVRKHAGLLGTDGRRPDLKLGDGRPDVKPLTWWGQTGGDSDNVPLDLLASSILRAKNQPPHQIHRNRCLMETRCTTGFPIGSLVWEHEPSPSPRETTERPSPSCSEGLFAKVSAHRRLEDDCCTCPKAPRRGAQRRPKRNMLLVLALNATSID